MAKISDREWQGFVLDLREFHGAATSHRREGSEDSRATLAWATTQLMDRVGREEFPSIVACLEMRGSELIETMAGLSAEDFPDTRDFRFVIESIEAREIFDACIEMEVESQDFLAVLHGYSHSKNSGQDLFASHGQDARAVVASLLDYLDD